MGKEVVVSSPVEGVGCCDSFGKFGIERVEGAGFSCGTASLIIGVMGVSSAGGSAGLGSDGWLAAPSGRTTWISWEFTRGRGDPTILCGLTTGLGGGFSIFPFGRTDSGRISLNKS